MGTAPNQGTFPYSFPIYWGRVGKVSTFTGPDGSLFAGFRINKDRSMTGPDGEL